MSFEFNTGDLILFTGDEWISWSIMLITKSYYSHVGMIVRDPCSLFPEREDMKNKKGVYVLESSYEPDLKVKDDANFLGVQLYPLFETHGVKYHRRLIINKEMDTLLLKKLINEVLGKRYDFFDLIEAVTKVPIRPRYDKAFFCSSLIAYIYTNLGFLPPKEDWNTFLPKDFSSSNLNILYNSCGYLEKERKI